MRSVAFTLLIVYLFLVFTNSVPPDIYEIPVDRDEAVLQRCLVWGMPYMNGFISAIRENDYSYPRGLNLSHIPMDYDPCQGEPVLIPGVEKLIYYLGFHRSRSYFYSGVFIKNTKCWLTMSYKDSHYSYVAMEIAFRLAIGVRVNYTLAYLRVHDPFECF